MFIDNSPNADIMIRSMASVGYNMEASIADIIDNSISANATDINIITPINHNEIYLAISDNGIGMNKNELRNAMKLGSRIEYDDKNLGAFGMGLKTASFAHSTTLIVATKKDNEINIMKWDTERIKKQNNWMCEEININDIDDNDLIQRLIDKYLHPKDSGTIIIWDKLIYKQTTKHDIQKQLYIYLNEQIEKTKKHIALIFHRFLQNGINISINNVPIAPLDPFVSYHPKIDIGKEMFFEGTKIIKYVLPFIKDLNKDDKEKLGGEDNIKKRQGFYIYRNNRLIQYGTWFDMSPKEELAKYARISIDIGKECDEKWEIDVKKQKAKPPKDILNYLKNSVLNTIDKSRTKISGRVNDLNDEGIWIASTIRKDNNECSSFSINLNNDYVKRFLSKFSQNDREKIERFMDLLSANLPLENIYWLKARNKLQLQANQESIIRDGVEYYRYLEAEGKDRKSILDSMGEFRCVIDQILKEIDNEQ